ncbi:hypothetical protein RIF29_05883 [Crotalaria pallida]|uniref:Uncharacterized protein n=1 Tax=Crotalaria pallida TaxID=3830 RepID=A0AAN9J3K7_CROPI
MRDDESWFGGGGVKRKGPNVICSSSSRSTSTLSLSTHSAFICLSCNARAREPDVAARGDLRCSWGRLRLMTVDDDAMELANYALKNGVEVDIYVEHSVDGAVYEAECPAICQSVEDIMEKLTGPGANKESAIDLDDSKSKKCAGVKGVTDLVTKKSKILFKGSTSEKPSVDESQPMQPMNPAQLAIYWSNLLKECDLLKKGNEQGGKHPLNDKEDKKGGKNMKKGGKK